jgi:uncharacterized RDD family membrane protein YckC
MTQPPDPGFDQVRANALTPPAAEFAQTTLPAAGYAYAQPGTAVPAGMYVDQLSGLALPAGVQLASSGRRIGAFFLSIPLAIVTLGIGYAIWGLIVWGRGQTPALQVLGMRCWRPETGRVAGWGWMLLRETIGRIAENILSILTEILSLILMLSRPDRKTLHDLVAGTVVLYDPAKVLQNRSA